MIHTNTHTRAPKVCHALPSYAMLCCAVHCYSILTHESLSLYDRQSFFIHCSFLILDLRIIHSFFSSLHFMRVFSFFFILRCCFIHLTIISVFKSWCVEKALLFCNRNVSIFFRIRNVSFEKREEMCASIFNRFKLYVRWLSPFLFCHRRFHLVFVPMSDTVLSPRLLDAFVGRCCWRYSLFCYEFICSTFEKCKTQKSKIRKSRRKKARTKQNKTYWK